MFVTSVIEGRPALHLKRQRTEYGGHAPDDLMTMAIAGNSASGRHKVGQFGCTARGQKTGDKDVGFWPIELLADHIIANGSNLEISALLVIENGCKDARGIEVWHAQPIDGAIDSDKRDRVHVADHSVVLNGLVGHGS